MIELKITMVTVLLFRSDIMEEDTEILPVKIKVGKKHH